MNKSKGILPKEKYREPMVVDIDQIMCRCFDAFYWHSTGSRFKSNSSNIRRLTSKWKGELDWSSPSSVLKSYTVSRFFDRYVFAHEDNNETQTKKRLVAHDGFTYINELGTSLFNPSILRLRHQPAAFSLEEERARLIIGRASELIADVLGDSPTKEEIMKEARDGPNGSFSLPFCDANIVSKAFAVDRTQKLDSRPDILRLVDTYSLTDASVSFKDWWDLGFTDLTRPVFRIDGRLLLTDYVYCESIVGGNRLSSVPKSFEKDRLICAEPTLNLRLQMALGRSIQKRLRKVGIDLATQPQAHRALCKVVSKFSLPIATIDWENASDRLWLELVRWLLQFCPQWLDLLEVARSEQTYFEGRWHESAMFSTMGNGATFPLQTLLFWAVCTATCEYLGLEDTFVSVFGDDCIVPAASFDLLEEVSRVVGWRMNVKKSFANGPFRESCGMDSYRGYNVGGPRPKNIQKNGKNVYRTHDPFEAMSFVLDPINSYCDLVEQTQVGLSRCDILSSEPFVELFTFLRQTLGSKIPLVPLAFSNAEGIRAAVTEVNALKVTKLASLLLFPIPTTPRERRFVYFQRDDGRESSRVRAFIRKFENKILKWSKEDLAIARRIGIKIGVKPSIDANLAGTAFRFFHVRNIVTQRKAVLSEQIMYQESIRRRGGGNLGSPYSADVIMAGFERKGVLVRKDIRRFELKSCVGVWSDPDPTLDLNSLVWYPLNNDQGYGNFLSRLRVANFPLFLLYVEERKRSAARLKG